MKYRKKPVVIEAVQFEPGYYTKAVWFSEGNLTVPIDSDSDWTCEQCENTARKHGNIKTLEGFHIVCPGDYIIKGIKGEFYPCKPDIFKQTYESVEAHDVDKFYIEEGE